MPSGLTVNDEDHQQTGLMVSPWASVAGVCKSCPLSKCFDKASYKGEVLLGLKLLSQVIKRSNTVHNKLNFKWKDVRNGGIVIIVIFIKISVDAS